MSHVGEASCSNNTRTAPRFPLPSNNESENSYGDNLQTDICDDAGFKIIQARTAFCQKLVDKDIDGINTFDVEFPNNLRELGFSAAEAKDYSEQAVHRLKARRGKTKQPQTEPRDLDGSSEGPAAQKQNRSQTISEEDRNKDYIQAVEESAWSALRAKLEQASAQHDSPSLAFDKITSFSGGARPASNVTNIPPSVFAAAPHLVKLCSKVSADPIIAKSWELRQEFSKGKVVDSLINLGQCQPLKDPISRSIWRLVILDQFVDFEKLYATLCRGYDYNDEPGEFGGRFPLVGKEHAPARRVVQNEADWTRVFDAWAAAVLLFYPHREPELATYRGRMLDLFHYLPSAPHFAIRFDNNTRDRYARNPFRLDDLTSFTSPFGRECSALALLQVPSALSLIRHPLVNARQLSVRIGIWGSVPQSRARVAVATTFVASVAGATGLEITMNATQNLSDVESSSEQLLELMRRSEEMLSPGIRSLLSTKRKSDIRSHDIPRFRRRFLWDSEPSSASMSPSAVATETALPLPLPPEHLLKDHRVDATLKNPEHAHPRLNSMRYR